MRYEDNTPSEKDSKTLMNESDSDSYNIENDYGNDGQLYVYSEEEEPEGKIECEDAYIYEEDVDNFDLPEEEVYDEEYYESLDTSGPNYSQVQDEAPEATATSSKDVEDTSVSSFFLLLKVLLNPIEGWKSIRRARLSVSRAQTGCFYPLLALLTVSTFAELFYSPRIGIGMVSVRSIVAFISFFFGYYIIIILLKLLMPGAVKRIVVSEFGRVFVIMCLSSLCLFYSAVELFQMLWALLIFLPLWTIYVICRGARFFRFPFNSHITCTAILCFLIVGVPLLLDWILMKILPY